MARLSYGVVAGCLVFVAAGVFVVGKMVAPESAVVAKTPEQVLEETTRAAEAGDAAAQTRLALSLEKKEDYDAAMRWYARAAEQGNAEAQFSLGTLLCKRRQDYAGGLPWLEKSAAQGHGGAIYNLGWVNWNGIGRRQDRAEGLRMFREAGQRGLVDAQMTLGAIYLRGEEGVSRDLVEAYRWLSLAQIQGQNSARIDLEACRAAMTPEQLAEARQRVKEALATKPEAGKP